LKLFVHIPKTAGTSFRWALEKYFSESRVIQDYGPDAAKTSELVRQHIYGAGSTGGMDALIRAITAQNAKILVGHFSLEKYVSYFDPREIMAFVRDPLVRTCSEYLHRKGNQTFSGTFTQFIQTPAYQNTLSRYLKGVSSDSMIGITERYHESLHEINQCFGWKLKTRRRNVALNKGGLKFAENLSVPERELFYKINQQDVEFYDDQVRCFAAHEFVHS